jgi:5-methyltetrahydropteroyltriglutamate--homocysteine methyltransferase
MAVAEVLASHMPGLPATCVQVDEANIPRNPVAYPLDCRAIDTVLDSNDDVTEKAVHFCFGNYGGQTIQQGEWKALTEILNSLRCDHLVIELAHRPTADLGALKEIGTRIGLEIVVIDIKVNHIETLDEIAARSDAVEKKSAPIGCALFMLRRSLTY